MSSPDRGPALRRRSPTDESEGAFDGDALRVVEPAAFDVRAAKLRPIAAGVGVVHRVALIDQIAHSKAAIVAVVAPAGYGKTTLLAQFADDNPNSVAWLSTDSADNDPAVLCTYLAAALDRLAPVGSDVVAAVASHGTPAVLGALLAKAIELMALPFTLVIDQLECVTNPECLDIIERVAVGLPEGAQLVMSSREQLRLPTPRLRAHGRLLEIGATELALDVDDAKAVLASAGIALTGREVDTLVDRVEGWPAGLHLATIAMNVGSPNGQTPFGLTGDHRIVGDYLRAEILDRLSPEDASFLKRASILESVSGSLCDATLGVTGSVARLEDFENRNLLVVPLDDRREWYRFRRLFSELLRSELHRHEPGLEVELHARAAAWYHANGRREEALAHAQAAGDDDRVATLVSELMHPAWASGRAETVRGWLEWLATEDLLGRYPALAVHGALMYALDGFSATAETWAIAAEESDVLTDPADGSSTETILAYLRAFLCRDGPAAMRADSILAYNGLSPTSPYRASMLFTEGLSHLIEGDATRAEPLLIRSAEAATAFGADPFAAMVFAVLGRVAAARDDWTSATQLGQRALGLIADGSFDEYWSSAPVFSFGATIAIRSARIDDARSRLAQAARLRPRLTYALPVMSVITLLDMAHSYIALTDRVGAMTVVSQAQSIGQQRPALGLLGAQVEELRARVDSTAIILAGGSSLTAAELRLAPLLATHLTLQEIGSRLYVSRSTAKTQAVAIYHKLGVRSRGEAVDILRELGLIKM